MNRTAQEKRSPWLVPFRLLLERVLGSCAAGLLFLMMLLTFVDVIGRRFGMPVPGGFEITELMLAALIFLGLPLLTASDGHVCVDLFDPVIPDFLKPVQKAFANVVTVGAFGVLAWMMWKHAFRTYNYADTTAVLQIPYSPLVFLMAAMATLTTIVQALMFLVNNGNPLLRPGKDTNTD